jgi:hypothetical protein
VHGSRRAQAAPGCPARREPKPRHGRRETRQLGALADPALDARAGEAGEHEAAWPHLRRVCRVRWRRVHLGTGDVEDEISDAVTGLPPERADAARLLRLLRGHRGIENELHRVRDVTFAEDRSQVRTGAAPQACAACRILVISLLRRAGASNIAAAVRTDAGRPRIAIALVASAGCAK